MDKINFNTWRETVRGQNLHDKIWLTWRFTIEAWIIACPVIAVVLWLVLAFLLHKYEFYKFAGTDIFPVLGTIAAVAAVLIAENQLHSWKQEKLLDRFEALYLSADNLCSLCDPLLNSSAWIITTNQTAEIVDNDMVRFQDIAISGRVNREAITATCLNMSHQILFIQKLLTTRTFHLNKATDAHTFLSKTHVFCTRITRFVEALDQLGRHHRGEIRYEAAPGVHKALLDDIQSSKEALNVDRNDRLPEDRTFMIQPHDLIKMRVLVLIRTLRI